MDIRYPRSDMSVENTQEWVWDPEETTHATVLKHGNQEVCFHPSYSSGTAAVRGNIPCTSGRDYYWEIEMLSTLYGTDVMVGVGTIKADLKKFQFQFGSLLGSDEESWGYSYRGILCHNGILRQYGSGFSQGSIIGIHLDMWQGTLTFYRDRQSLGVAFTSLKAHALYPMVCSTAARSAMRIVCSYSSASSLQLLCLRTLSPVPGLVKKMQSIPGLRAFAKEAFWHFYLPSSTSIKGNENNQLCLQGEDDDSDLDEAHVFSHAIISGKLHQTHPVSVVKRQTTKRTTYNGSRERNLPELQDLCVICQRRDRSSTPSTASEGNSTKRMCLACDIMF